MPSKQHLNVLALDPGERVGWTTSTITTGDQPRLTIDDYGILRLKDAGLALEGEAPGGTPDFRPEHFDAVIFETWILTAKGARDAIGSEMESSQFIGMVRSACWRSPRTKIVRSLPKRKTDALMYLRNDHPDYAAAQAIVDAAPARHDDAHYADAVLHTVAYFHKEFV